MSSTGTHNVKRERLVGISRPLSGALVRPITHSVLTTVYLSSQIMSTPIILGIGAIAAAFAGRQFMRRSAGAAEQWVKGGFKNKMDRTEAIAILGLKYVHRSYYLDPHKHSHRSFFSLAFSFGT